MGQGRMLSGLIGFPLGHSWSPSWFNEKFRLAGDIDKEYRLFPLPSLDEFPALLENCPELVALNVTIPYKEKIIPYLDELDATARTIGAVNAIKITRKNGHILTTGFNTDSLGFLQSISGQFLQGPALILGTGGAAKAVANALQENGIRFDFVSRNHRGPGIFSYHDLDFDLIRSRLLIINATPLGMYPETGNFPQIPYQHLTEKHCLYDLVYNPAETEFMKRGKIMKAKTMNGKQMLVNQAKLSYNIFFGQD